MISNDLILAYSILYLIVLAVTVNIYKISCKSQTKTNDKNDSKNLTPSTTVGSCGSAGSKLNISISETSNKPSSSLKTRIQINTENPYRDEDSFTNTDDDDDNDSGFGNDISEFILPEMSPTFAKPLFSDLSEAARGTFIDLTHTHKFKLRGATYLVDQKKDDPGPAMCKLMLMELYRVDTSKDGDRHDHVVSRGLAQKRLQAIRSLPGNPFVFVVNFQMPGDPPFSMVCFFALRKAFMNQLAGPGLDCSLELFKEYSNLPVTEVERLKLWGIIPSNSLDSDNCNSEDPSDSSKIGQSTFGIFGSDITWPDGTGPGEYPQSDFRNRRLKVIPMVSEAPWVVQATIPSKPTMIARKVAHRYFAGEGYIETDTYIGSSYAASRIIGICRGASKYCAVDVGIVLQGETPEELPERLIGAFTVNHVDTTMLRSLDE